MASVGKYANRTGMHNRELLATQSLTVINWKGQKLEILREKFPIVNIMYSNNM